jgi:hypothetical protein
MSHSVYYGDKIKQGDVTGGGCEECMKMLLETPEGKRPLGRRTRHRWEDNIKTDIRETGGDNVDWYHLAQHRDQWRGRVNSIMNLLLSLASWVTIGF